MAPILKTMKVEKIKSIKSHKQIKELVSKKSVLVMVPDVFLSMLRRQVLLI